MIRKNWLKNLPYNLSTYRVGYYLNIMEALSYVSEFKTEEQTYLHLRRKIRGLEHMSDKNKYETLFELKMYLEQDLKQHEEILTNKKEHLELIKKDLIEADLKMNSIFIKKT